MNLRFYAILIIAGCILISLYTVYQLDIKYWTPTPQPKSFQPVALGTQVGDVNQKQVWNSQKPTLLHFFNPACPCSRFNLPHLVDLYHDFGSEFDFKVVLCLKKPNHRQWYIDYGSPIPFLEDTKGALARVCGVYTTPQAVILDTNGKIVFRGNYNLTRFCTNVRTFFVQMALSEYAIAPILAKDEAVCTPYGCLIPSFPSN